MSVSGRIDLNNLGARPVEGGRENDGTPLYIVRAYYKEAVHPGKTNPKLNGRSPTFTDSILVIIRKVPIFLGEERRKRSMYVLSNQPPLASTLTLLQQYEVLCYA